MDTVIPPGLVVDANVVVGLCARERDKYDLALAELERYTTDGYQLFAPGILLGEVLFVLCKKLVEGKLTPSQHDEAIEDLCTYLSILEPPPDGDGALARRAEAIRAGYGCSRSADGIYIALAEKLGADRNVVLLTFDDGITNQASKNAPTVIVRVLVPSPDPEGSEGKGQDRC